MNSFQVCLVPKIRGSFIEGLEEIIEKNYNVPGNPGSNGDLGLEEAGWAVNAETDDDVIINDESGIEDCDRWGHS